MGISVNVLFRKTLTLTLEASSSSRWNSFSLLYSDQLAIKVAITTAIAIPNPSYQGANPKTANNTVTPKATIKMTMMGSFKFLSSLSRKFSDS